MRRFFSSSSTTSSSNTSLFATGRNVIKNRAFTQTIQHSFMSFPKSTQYSLLAAAGILVFAGGVYQGRRERARGISEGTAAAPDVESLSRDMLETFEFRPDLAPTMIRLAFVLCSMRQRQARLNEKRQKIVAENQDTIKTGGAGKDGKPNGSPMSPAEVANFVERELGRLQDQLRTDKDDDHLVDNGWNICSSFDGLDEAVEVLAFHQLSSSVSMQDLAVIAAITAIRFMKGPWEDLKFRYGRSDDLVEDIILREEAVKTQKLDDMSKEKKKFFSAKRGENNAVNNNNNVLNQKEDSTKLMNLIPIPPEEKIKNPSKYVQRLSKNIKNAIPSLSDEEIVSLFALHGIGEYHADVCGLERHVKPSRCNYIISAQYFRTMAKLNFQPMDPIPRSKRNLEVVAFPQMMQAGIQVLNTSGEKVKKTCACPVGEYCMLMMKEENNNKNKSKNDTNSNNNNNSSNPFLEYVKRFSDREFGEQIWSHSFQKAMQAVFDDGCEVMTTPNLFSQHISGESSQPPRQLKLKELPDGKFKIGKSTWYGEKLPKLIRPEHY